jgi:hypothetical protein
MSAYITIKDAINHLKEGHPSDITFCTCDIKRNKGGDSMTYKNATLVGVHNKDFGRNSIGNVQKTSDKPHRNRANATISIRLANNDIVSVHPVLFEFFNNKEVI